MCAILHRNAPPGLEPLVADTVHGAEVIKVWQGHQFLPGDMGWVVSDSQRMLIWMLLFLACSRGVRRAVSTAARRLYGE